MEIHTIGFTRKSAVDFFGALRAAGIGRLVDVRLNNVSQLAGFTKRDDLAFFLAELCGAEYVHEPLLAPTGDLLKAYRDGRIDWDTYETAFRSLLAERAMETAIEWASLLERPVVLLCSEPTAERCHRRLVVEYLQESGFDLMPVHI